MPLHTNDTFERLLKVLNGMGQAARQSPTQDPVYQDFLRRFPLAQLRDMSLDSYCVGKGDGASFCWWIERGLVPVLGRYTPGTSRGHLLYFLKDHMLYKHRGLKDLGDAAALRYTLQVQATIAEADPAEDLRWIDDDALVYQRAGVEARVTAGDGRKLRLLAAYHPDDVLPISSSDHLAHFLAALGCLPDDIPPQHAPVARMLMLIRYQALASESCPGLTPHGFMNGLYAKELRIAPLKDADAVLAHFSAAPELAGRLKSSGQSDVFCQLALALHEAELDWWITPDHAIYAGRANDAHLRDTTPLLAFHLASEGLSVRTSDADNWELLDADVAARVADVAQASLADDGVAQREACWPDDYNDSPALLEVQLTAGAVRNGYINIPKMQALFPTPYLAATEATATATFTLVQPDGVHVDTRVLANKNRIHARFNKLFKTSDLQEGDVAVISAAGEGVYRLAFRRQEITAASGVPIVVATKDARTMSTIPLNQILFGPPGTGKTHATISRAVEILNPALYARHRDERIPGNRDTLKAEFDRLSSPNVRRVQFVTFHQSFSYEDFVEGIRAVTDDTPDGAAGGLAYRVEPGVFKRLCTDSRRGETAEPHVLIIDEINRGNVSRIFGELITLLEPSKRAGTREALDVILPYSKERFSVPENVYLIGTMNTADRSLAGLDAALRRRFVFHELVPKPELLRGVVVTDGTLSVPVGALLEVMNHRIEALLDREHKLGHAYFLPLEATPTLEKLAHIFRRQVLPLLQEYFFDDWERIRWVLNDHRKKTDSALMFIKSSGPDFAELFGTEVQVPRHRQSWSINQDAFKRLDSYAAIIDVAKATGMPAQ
jgi:hypothetical protein